MDGWRVGGWTDGWVDGWIMDGQKDRWTDGRMNKQNRRDKGENMAECLTQLLSYLNIMLSLRREWQRDCELRPPPVFREIS